MVPSFSEDSEIGGGFVDLFFPLLISMRSRPPFSEDSVESGVSTHEDVASDPDDVL